MGLDYLHLIPNDLMYYYIWPKICNNIKMVLNKQLFYKYYPFYYNEYCTTKIFKGVNTKYLIYIIKNDIGITLSYLLKIEIPNIYKKKKLYYNDLIFYDYYNFFLYLSKKYKSYFCQYLLNNYLIQLNIKEYKKYINKNIGWIK